MIGEAGMSKPQAFGCRGGVQAQGLLPSRLACDQGRAMRCACTWPCTCGPLFLNITGCTMCLCTLGMGSDALHLWGPDYLSQV